MKKMDEIEIQQAAKDMPCPVCLGDFEKHRNNNSVGANKCICEGTVETPGTFWAAWTGAKVALIRATIQKSRSESPDGKTQWDRVEDFRVAHGHLPGDKDAEKSCQKCKGVL